MSRYSKRNASNSSERHDNGPLRRLAEDLAATSPEELDRVVRRLGRRLPGMTDPEYRQAVEALCSLFYVDLADRPELEPVLDRVTVLLARQGTTVIPVLLRQMESSDIKSHLHLARALGQIGAPALPKLRDLLATAEDPYTRSFAMYAIGKMRCADVARAIPEVLGGLMHPDKEVRDTAARTLGRISAVVPPKRLTARRRREMLEALVRAARDPEAPVRAKAMRSLGKMASAGLLDRAQRQEVLRIARAAMGQGEEYGWDNAFIVRREAREVLEVCRES